MNFDFTYYTPTKIYFGRNALTNLRTELPKYGPTVLMVYGRNSIKKNGLYDTIMAYMKEAGKTVVELSGVMSNPTVDKLREGVDLARKRKVDVVLAVGGGCVGACSKGLAASATAAGDV
uniref:iron-containing alcohol dehydrogenase n=1 Tax=Veillonella magna TaxID=464322 RepID=UPI00402A79B1